jgi:hypothetical protein
MACLHVCCFESLQEYQSSASNQASMVAALMQAVLKAKGNWSISLILKKTSVSNGEGCSPQLNFLIKYLLNDWCPGHWHSSLDLQALLFLNPRSGPIQRELLEDVQALMH